jgi:hypothetical protein
MVRSAEDRGFQRLFTPPSKTDRSRVLGRSRFGVVEDVLEDLFADAAFLLVTMITSSSFVGLHMISFPFPWS